MRGKRLASRWSWGVAHGHGAAFGSQDLGKTQASESGTHRCNGDMAHWEFKGLRDLVEALNPPCDGAILWIEKFAASSEELRKLIPARPDLGVFAWESRQRRSRA